MSAGYRVYEVFTQKKPGDAFVHQGDVEAPDAETAILLAKEHFARRQACTGLWVAARDDVHVAPWDEVTLSSGHDKTYRRSTGFRSSSLDILKADA